MADTDMGVNEVKRLKTKTIDGKAKACLQAKATASRLGYWLL